MDYEDNQGGYEDQEVTGDIDAHYHTSRRSNGATALYGLLALVVTFIVAAGLYFGGRAVYRVLTNTGENDTTQQEAGGSGGSPGANGTTGQTPGISSDTPNGGSKESQSGGNGGSSSNMPSTGDNLPATGSPTGI